MSKKISISKEHKLSDLTSVSQTIKPIAKQIMGAAGFMEIEILSNWRDIVGENTATYTLPRKIIFPRNKRTQGCLHLLTLNGAFAMEVQQKQKQIMEKINIYFGYNAIDKILIIQTGNAEDFLLTKKSIDNVKKNLVSADEENYITEQVKNIKDENLRIVLGKLGRAVFSDNDQQEY